MTDIFDARTRSQLMAKVKATGNKGTELKLMRVFRSHKIVGWRRGSTMSGKPDFAFPKLRTAVFVDGCFWHGCPKHATWPKGNAAFWMKKIEGNIARDRRVNRELRGMGWRVVRIWEHELARKNERRLLARLRRHGLVVRGSRDVMSDL